MTAVATLLTRPAQREIGRLDKAWVDQHMAGLPAVLPLGETRDMHAAGCNELVDAIPRLPAEIKTAFEEALARCPSLVAYESDPARFLRREGFNGWAAALRLMEYWTTRKKMFDGKAFLPMTLATGGALEDDDLVLLKSGALAILPEVQQGRLVRLDMRCLLDESQSISRMILTDFPFPLHCVCCAP